MCICAAVFLLTLPDVDCGAACLLRRVPRGLVARFRCHSALVSHQVSPPARPARTLPAEVDTEVSRLREARVQSCREGRWDIP